MHRLCNPSMMSRAQRRNELDTDENWSAGYAAEFLVYGNFKSSAIHNDQGDQDTRWVKFDEVDQIEDKKAARAVLGKLIHRLGELDRLLSDGDYSDEHVSEDEQEGEQEGEGSEK